MRKFIVLLSLIFIAIWILSFFYSWKIGVVFSIIGILFFFGCVTFLFFNKLLKKTNWWNNQYIATRQFVSNVGYRSNIIRNYDIINLGSNPAHFAFFYEGIRGQSWATGSQGQDMDFEVLKYYHSYLKEGATVIIPIMPFSAISTYLKSRPEYWDLTYYSKFAMIIDRSQSIKLPYGRDLLRYLSYPLLYNIRAIRYLFFDVQPDNRYQISEQLMMSMELEQDAKLWISNWIKEFDIKSLYDVLDERWIKYYNEAIDLNKSIVDFCLERGLKPSFVCAPMTKHLSDLFPEEFHQYMITDFINKINKHNIPFLDYTYDERFNNDDLYFNSYFLNLKGRKLFTKQVLRDLNVV